MEENRNWYLSNTGYVLQLAAPYYEELTVRENLTLAAWVKLHISSREKFERVEQVMEVVRYKFIGSFYDINVNALHCWASSVQYKNTLTPHVYIIHWSHVNAFTTYRLA